MATSLIAKIEAKLFFFKLFVVILRYLEYTQYRIGCFKREPPNKLKTETSKL